MTRLSLALALLLPGAAHALTGGPDGFGYTFVDSDEADGPSYAWTDISSTGTGTGISDDGEEVIAVPFEFWFYGRGYTEVTVGDGALVFGTNDGISNRNQCLPGNNRDGDDALILPLWDDLDNEEAKTGGDVYWEVLGHSPDQQLVIQYQDVPHYDSGTYFTFQVVLEETTNAILFQYASVEGPDEEYTQGGSATVGIQKDQSTALEYGCASAELVHDGLAVLFDIDCEGEDADGDGVGWCTGDCDDSNPDVWPGAKEADDGLDNDCDDLVDEDFVSVGDLVLTELMPDPDPLDDEDGEWFELYNSSSRSIDLQGWTLADSGGSVTVNSSVIVEPGTYAVLAASSDPMTNGGIEGVAWVFDWDTVHLNNSGDSLQLSLDGTVIDELSYDASVWPVTEGASIFLDPGFVDAEGNDEVTPWCATPSEKDYDYTGLGGGPYGTPGRENPAGLCCHDDDGDGWDVCAGDCDDEDPDLFPDNPEIADLEDDDCDGYVDEDFVSEGMVVVTEFMDDPYAVEMDRGEWFELYNAGELDLDLYLWQLTDDAGHVLTIDESFLLEAGAHAVFAVSDDPELNGNLPAVDWVYDYELYPLDSFVEDDISIVLDELVVHSVAWSDVAPWPDEPGRAAFLCPGFEATGGSADGQGWAVMPAHEDFDYGGTGSGDYGTPGQANPSFDLDGDGLGPCDGDCDDGDASVGPGSTEDCTNGRDDDCDGLVDAEDEDCGAVDTAGETALPEDTDQDHPDDDDDTDSDDDDDDKEGCEGCGGGAGGTGLLAMALVILGVGRRRQDA